MYDHGEMYDENHLSTFTPYQIHQLTATPFTTHRDPEKHQTEIIVPVVTILFACVVVLEL